MTRFRHDLILRMIKLLDAVLVTIPFAMCWYLYYAKRVASPYYAKGDYLVVALFFVLFIIFGRVYDAFLMSMQRISEIIYEQFLAAAVSDFIMYIVIWLLSKHLPNILPGVAALVGQVIMASIWAYNAHHAYFKTFPPQATAVIYDTRRGMEQLIGKYGLDAKYKVVSTATAGECIENLSMLDGINTVFLSGIHSHDRNIILKYCVENNITVFVVPRIGDTINQKLVQIGGVIVVGGSVQKALPRLRRCCDPHGLLLGQLKYILRFRHLDTYLSNSSKLCSCRSTSIS